MTRTPWYSARDHKPVRVGWYEFQCDGFPRVRLLWFTGRNWKMNKYSGRFFAVLHGDRWRGLTEEHRG